MPDADPSLLELLAQAFSEPGLIQRHGRRLLRPLDMPWEVFEDTLTRFVEVTVAEDPSEETRRRLRSLLADLHVRPSLLSQALMQGLGVHDIRASVLRCIHAAFPPTPLVGRPLGEAVLEDERAFRVVLEAEVEAVRASAETRDWRKLPEVEIERAFEKTSVYLWLDDSAWSFYVPAFLSHALHHPAGQCEFFTLLTFLELSPSDAMGRWTHDQRHAIAWFLAFVSDDQPWSRLLLEHRDSLAAWRTLLS